MNNSAWQRARKTVGLSYVRVHDLKHTFGRRLRAAGVSFEDRQDLLGHKSGRITTHYSAAELQNLIEAATKVDDRSKQGSVMTLLRTYKEVFQLKVQSDLHKSYTVDNVDLKKKIKLYS